MALTVEDGSGVTGANSYISRDDFIAYALSRGVTVASVDATDVLLVKAADYIDSHEVNLKGERVLRDQAMAWPRGGVIIEGFAWANDEIPRQLINCQAAFALELNGGEDIYNPAPSQVAKMERVEGALTVEYFGTDGGVKMRKDSRASALLNLLLRPSGYLNLVSARA